jgi:hypothetical protein
MGTSSLPTDMIITNYPLHSYCYSGARVLGLGIFRVNSFFTRQNPKRSVRISVPVDITDHRTRRYHGSAYPSISRILWISVSVNITYQRTRHQRYYGSSYPSILRISVPVDNTDQRTRRYYGSVYPSILRISVPVDKTDQRTRRYNGSAYPSI